MKMCVKLVALLCVVLLSADIQAQGKTGRRKYFGELTKVDGKTLTVMTEGKDAKLMTFTVSAKTNIRIETDEDEIIKLKGDATMRQPKEKAGKFDDLKPGQRLSIVPYEDSSANLIVVKRPKKKDEEKK